MTHAVVLASQSAARRQLLSGAGVAFEAEVSGVDEDELKRRMLAADATPREVAEALAEAKALRISSQGPALVIGADQTLEFDGGLYDKVATIDAARSRLKALRGQPHHLHSAVVLARGGEVLWKECATATLTMRHFSDEFLEDYLQEEGTQALGSVGCYRLEGMGAQLFTRIKGDYFAILGLPLLGLLEALRSEGVIIP